MQTTVKQDTTLKQETAEAFLEALGAWVVSDVQVATRGGHDTSDRIFRVVTYDVAGRIFAQRHWGREGRLAFIEGGFIS